MTVRLLPGQIIPGTRYRVIAKIGQGAMGVVYAAEHVELEKKVALKLLVARIAQRADAIERFRREARAASKIGSPYICDVTDFGSLEDGRAYFVMEYLEGRSLRAILDAEGSIEPGRAIAILRQTAKALGAAHDKGIIHLDVKPDNVMLMSSARRADAVKVVDFGIAGLLEEGRDKQHDTVNGTPAYMAPERAIGRGYDRRSDIYSLGVMAYEALCGTIPFESEDVATTLRKHIIEEPEPLRARAPDRKIPQPLEELVFKMMSKDPADRPQSMAEVEALLCEAQIAAGLTSAWDDLELPLVEEEWRHRLAERMPSPRSRRSRKILGGAVGVAAVAVVAAIYFGAFRTKIVTVYNEVTKTEEPREVAEQLELAVRAARAHRYVPPPEDSALVHIEQAEGQAEKLGRDSPGARTLRQSYGGALAVAGDSMLQAGLRDIAIEKFKEALLFDPGDPELRRKAELTPSERQALDEHTRRRDRATARKVVADDPAKHVAATLFEAARDGRTSEARAALKALAQVDRGGAQAAKMADALRPLARAGWSGGRSDEARALYALIAELDPSDREARERSRPEPTKAAPPPPPPPPEPAVVAAAPPVKGKRREGDDLPEAPRDPAASRTSAQVGNEALRRGRLDEAEVAFRRAIKTDPTNAVAIGGLAEAAFERAHYTDALDFGRRAMKLAPRSAHFLTIVGDSYFKLLRYVEAKSAYERAIALAPDDQSLQSRMQRVKAKIGER
jgi:serine/threonine protein kinase